MDDALQCGNCGMWIHCFIRHCPACGKTLLISLNKANAKPELFFDLMTSLYNLVADNNNANRSRYLPSMSENIILRRCSVEFSDELHDLSLNYSYEADWPEEVKDLHAMCLTNVLCGYVYRTIEEFITDRKSPKLSSERKERLWGYLDANRETLKNSCYSQLDRKSDVDGRVLLCMAIILGKSHLEFMLADEQHQREWFSSIIEQSTERALEFYKRAFRALWPEKKIRDLIWQRHDFIRENVQRGFLFGYAVKLSESLIPYKLQATSQLH